MILGLDGSLIARAILHAREIDADIVSLSLGGAFVSKSVRRALDLAVNSGMIVVAAAGNCCGFVVYPASDVNSIGIAGVSREGVAWKGTSRGVKVDVAAPADNVFAARRSAGDNGREAVEPSQGTSFATALTAGVAALWLAHHGRQAVRDRAAAFGISVNDLFRSAVRQSSRRPGNGWDEGLGAGIVDAGALLALALDQVQPRSAPRVSLPPPTSPLDQHKRIAELAQQGETVEASTGDSTAQRPCSCRQRAWRGVSLILLR